MKKNVMKICCAVLAIAVIAALLIAVRGCHREEPIVPPTAPATEATQVVHTEAETQPPTVPVGEIIPTVDKQSELAAARKKNPDTVAWLYIPGAEVDDPVMQAEDNGHYLWLGEDGEYSTWGCYYAHCENHFSGRDKLDTNTTIFGHSASNCDPNGPKFTKLYRYMDADYVKDHPYIYLSVTGEDLVFQITALFITDIEFDYIVPNPTGSELTEFFRTVARKNWLNFDGVTFSEDDTVLTLSTCCRKYDTAKTGNQRLVVMAKLLPEGVTAQPYTKKLPAPLLRRRKSRKRRLPCLGQPPLLYFIPSRPQALRPRFSAFPSSCDTDMWEFRCSCPSPTPQWQRRSGRSSGQGIGHTGRKASGRR